MILILSDVSGFTISITSSFGGSSTVVVTSLDGTSSSLSLPKTKAVLLIVVPLVTSSFTLVTKVNIFFSFGFSASILYITVWVDGS